MNPAGRVMRAGVCGVLVLAATSGNVAEAAIVVNGKLDEPEWSQARRYADFKVTEPFRLSAPPAGTGTQARLVSTADGIAVAFIVEQPASIRRVKPRLQLKGSPCESRINYYKRMR